MSAPPPDPAPVGAPLLDARLLEAWLRCERRAWLHAHSPELASDRGGLGAHLVELRSDLRPTLRHALGAAGGAAPHPASPPERHGQNGETAGALETARAPVAGAALVLDARLVTRLERRPADRGRPAPGVVARVDALRRSPDGWTLSLLALGLRVREHHVRQLSLAWLASGGAARRAEVFHVDPSRSAPGSEPALVPVDVTERCAQAAMRLPAQLEALAASLAARREPATGIGPQCRRPYRCPFTDHCWEGIEGPSVFNVAGLRDVTREALRSAGWVRAHQVPSRAPGLTAAERGALQDARDGRVRVGRAALRAALARLRAPAAFLDIEFATAARPPAGSVAPFQPLPFQFSVHVQDERGGVAERAYLHRDAGRDPRPALAEALVRSLEDAATIVVYGRASEGTLLAGLREAAPHLTDGLDAARERLWDLREVVRATLRHPGFGDRAGLKRVAAVLAPGSYDGVELPDGLAAQVEWRTLLRQHDEAAAARLRAYCRADSLAMLGIVVALRALARRDGPVRS